jgi:hypothetical protein
MRNPQANLESAAKAARAAAGPRRRRLQPARAMWLESWRKPAPGWKGAAARRPAPRPPIVAVAESGVVIDAFPPRRYRNNNQLNGRATKNCAEPDTRRNPVARRPALETSEI